MYPKTSCSLPRRPDNRYGFTLVEMLVVIGIIILLISIILPSFNRVRDQARTAACLNNLRQIGAAFETYTTMNDGFMPPSYVGDLGTPVPLAKRSRWLYKLAPVPASDTDPGPPKIWADILMDGGMIDDPEVFRCQSGIDEQFVGSSGNVLVINKSLDYAINGYLNQSGIDSNINNNAWCGGGRLIGKKTTADTNLDGVHPQFNRFSAWPRSLITRPGEGMLVMDNLGGTKDGSAPRMWANDAFSTKPGQFRHLGRKYTNVLYFDGHAESRVVNVVNKSVPNAIFETNAVYAFSQPEQVYRNMGLPGAPTQASAFWRPWAPFFK